MSLWMLRGLYLLDHPAVLDQALLTLGTRRFYHPQHWAGAAPSLAAGHRGHNSNMHQGPQEQQ